jgi:molybdate transport system permease protein
LNPNPEKQTMPPDHTAMSHPAADPGSDVKPRRLNAERLFTIVVFTLLLTYSTFILAILLSDVFYVQSGELLKVLLSSETFFAIKLSFFTSIISTGLAVLFAVPGAYALSRYNFPGKAAIDTIIDLPMVLPPLIVGVSLLVFFNTSVGRWLEAHGLRLVYTVPGVILAQFAISSSFAVRAMKAAYDHIDPRYELAARSLGCNKFQAFYKVIVPLAKNGMIAGTVMTWARAVGEFVPILIFAGATRNKTTVLPTAIFLKIEVGDIQGAVSLTIIMMAIALIALLVFKKVGGAGESFQH